MRYASTVRLCLTAALALVLLSMVTVQTSCATVPMPYTSEALDKLNSVMTKIPPPKTTEGDNDHRVKTYVETYRNIFAAAGFDYERSMMKIINDIQFERYKLNKATIKLNGLARELLKLHVTTGVSPKKYLRHDSAELLLEFRTLIRSNMKKYGGC